MAPFNPDVPKQNPKDFTGVSKPISDPTPDRSGAMNWATAGDLLTGAVSLTDNTIKGVIKDDIRNNVEQLQNDTTAVYETVRNQTLAMNTPQVPGGLQAGLERVQNLGQAQAQNGGTGKANDTLYTAALNSYTKQLRSQYPGYRDYIDSEVQKVSGIDPANAYMRNLLEDINRNSTSQKGETEKAIALGRQYLGYDPNMPMYIEAVRQGLPGAVQNMERQVNRVAAQKVQYDNFKMAHDVKKIGEADDKIAAIDQFRTAAEKTAFNTFNAVLEVPGLTNPGTIQDLITKAQNGQVSLSTEQWEQLHVQAQGFYDRARMQLRQLASNRDTNFAGRIGSREEVNGQIEDALSHYKTMVEAIRNKDFGMLFGTQRRVQAAQDDAQKQILGSPLRTDALMGAAMQKWYGPGWTGMQMATQLQSGAATRYKDFLQDAQRRAMLPEADLRQMGMVKSLYSDVQAAQKASVPQSSRVYDNLVDNVNIIGNPPPKGVTAEQHQQAQREVTEYMFNPEKNGNLMKLFNRDFTDANGVFHPGKFAVYDTLTKPKIADGIWNLKDGASWDKYKNWQETSFAVLYRDEVSQLNKITSDGSIPTKMLWNSDTNQFEVQFVDQEGRRRDRVTTGVEARYIDNVRESVRNVNRGLANLSYMHKKEGGDTSAYLFDQMLNLGFNPSDNVQGMPQQIMRAIQSSKLKKGIEEAHKAAGGK